jgi:hypothetical protein
MIMSAWLQTSSSVGSSTSRGLFNVLGVDLALYEASHGGDGNQGAQQDHFQQSGVATEGGQRIRGLGEVLFNRQ